MAGASDLKAKLEAFVREQRQALMALEASTVVERRRLQAQVAAAQGVLDQWDAKVDGLIDTLALAGIHL